MKKVLALMLCLYALPATAGEWTREDTERETVYLMLHALDWGQTRCISAQCVPGRRYYETNRTLGRHPSRAEVDRYFLATGLAHVGIAMLLPREARKYFQYITINDRWGYVRRNVEIGLQISF